MGVQLKRTTDNKLVIQEITPKSPAEKAGFMVGDIISSIDGNAVKVSQTWFITSRQRSLEIPVSWRFNAMVRRFLIRSPF